MTTEDRLLQPPGGLGPVALSFVLSLLDEGVVETVARVALESKGQLPGGMRAELDRALDAHVRVDGFRSAGTAPAPVILRQVCELVRSSPHLATPVLRAWYETHPDLRSAVAAVLEDGQIPVREPENFAEPMEVVFQRSPVTDALAACVADLPDYDPDVVALMVQLLSGQALVDDFEAPEPGQLHIDDDLVVSKVLQSALELLAQMPPTAPEWEGAIPEFSASLVQLISTKQEEREAANTLSGVLSAMQEEYGGLLEFFQCDTSNWQLEASEPGFPFQQAHEQACRFRELLEEYARLHDRAPVAAEEMARATRRMELLPRILEANNSLQRMFNGEGPATDGEDQGSQEDTEPVCSDESGSGVALILSTAAGAGQELTEDLAPIPPCDVEFIRDLRSYVEDLEEENDDLEHENEGLKNHVKVLEQQLYETRTNQESLLWAVAYRDNPEETEEVPDLESVGAAVALAKERYPGQLLFELNADSDAEESVFKWPDQVWNALRWLATDYFTSHLGDHPIPNIDEACRQACGMWYKTGQHETTMTQFRESYTTRVNGRAIWLGEHIGKGNSFDPRRTIRIAFDWDRQLQKVVIGYIGQHQRTAAT